MNYSLIPPSYADTSILSHYTPYTIFTAIMIMAGWVIVSKLFWMVIYEIKYYRGAGEDYLYYGKEYTKNKYFYISSSSNIWNDNNDK
jgi:hypothetical protein